MMDCTDGTSELALAEAAACAARYASIETGVSLTLGGATRAAWPPRAPGAPGNPGTPGSRPGLGGTAGGGARVATMRLDHAPTAVRSAPILTRTCPSRFSIW